MRTKTQKKDLIFIGLILIAGIIFLLIFLVNTSEGQKAIVTIDGEKVAEYDLTKDCTYTIKTENGYNEITIKDGKISVTDASCPDHLCMNMGAINKSGETIVCLPNKLVITIEAAEKNEFDGVAK